MWPTDVETMWLLGEPDLVEEAQTRPFVHLGQFPDLSVVRLDFSDSGLLVELVQKGTLWPQGQSFCKEVLPATVHAFFEMHGIPLAAVKYVEVVSNADPPLAGCRCYTRLFRDMGFTEMNSEVIESDNEMLDFCQRLIASSHFKMISAIPGSDSPLLPQVSQIGQDFLDKASVISII